MLKMEERKECKDKREETKEGLWVITCVACQSQPLFRVDEMQGGS